MKFEKNGVANVSVDNKSAIVLGKNPIFHERTKHIDPEYHFIRECVGKKEIQLKHVQSKELVADMFTKALRFEDLCRMRAFLQSCQRLGYKFKEGC